MPCVCQQLLQSHWVGLVDGGLLGLAGGLTLLSEGLLGSTSYSRLVGNSQEASGATGFSQHGQDDNSKTGDTKAGGRSMACKQTDGFGTRTCGKQCIHVDKSTDCGAFATSCGEIIAGWRSRVH